MGYGNNGEDGTEGVHFKNVFGSYSHGPLLPKNPAFCDLLLLDDSAEQAAHDAMLHRLIK